MEDKRINIATDFTPYPGGRYPDGKNNSGQELRESLLWPETEDRFEKQLIKERLDDLNKDLKEFKKWIDGGGTFLASLMKAS